MNLLTHTDGGGFEATISALLDNTVELPVIADHGRQEDFYSKQGIEILLQFKLSPAEQAVRLEHYRQQKLLRSVTGSGVAFEMVCDEIRSRMRVLNQLSLFLLTQYRRQFPMLRGYQEKIVHSSCDVYGCIFRNWQMTYFTEKKLVQKDNPGQNK